MLSTEFLNPDFSIAYTIFILAFMGMILYAGIRLYSALTLIAWAFLGVVFVVTAIYDLPIVYFYLVLIVCIIIVGLSSMVYLDR